MLAAASPSGGDWAQGTPESASRQRRLRQRRSSTSEPGAPASEWHSDRPTLRAPADPRSGSTPPSARTVQSRPPDLSPESMNLPAINQLRSAGQLSLQDVDHGGPPSPARGLLNRTGAQGSELDGTPCVRRRGWLRDQFYRSPDHRWSGPSKLASRPTSSLDEQSAEKTERRPHPSCFLLRRAGARLPRSGVRRAGATHFCFFPAMPRFSCHW